jgi:DNA invertase Pin-like site-specific DNA recombinase
MEYGLSAAVQTPGPPMNAKRSRTVAIYSRVSTASQNTENQVRELRQVAERRGWHVVNEFTDPGISGAKGREGRPGLDAMMQAVARREIDMVMAWSVNRLGRSLQNLIEFLGELHGKHVDLYLHQQGIDTSTPAGKALFQMMGVFAEFERAMICERVNSGLARARAQGKKLGRPRRDEVKRTTAIHKLRKQGMGINKIARQLGCGVSAVQRIVRAE